MCRAAQGMASCLCVRSEFTCLLLVQGVGQTKPLCSPTLTMDFNGFFSPYCAGCSLLPQPTVAHCTQLVFIYFLLLKRTAFCALTLLQRVFLWPGPRGWCHRPCLSFLFLLASAPGGGSPADTQLLPPVNTHLALEPLPAHGCLQMFCEWRWQFHWELEQIPEVAKS